MARSLLAMLHEHTMYENTRLSFPRTAVLVSVLTSASPHSGLDLASQRSNNYGKLI